MRDTFLTEYTQGTERTYTLKLNKPVLESAVVTVKCESSSEQVSAPTVYVNGSSSTKNFESGGSITVTLFKTKFEIILSNLSVSGEYHIYVDYDADERVFGIKSDKSFAETYSKDEVYTKDEVYSKNEVDNKVEVKISTLQSGIAAAVSGSSVIPSASFYFPDAPLTNNKLSLDEINAYLKAHFRGLGRFVVLPSSDSDNDYPSLYPICGYKFGSSRVAGTMNYRLELKVFLTNLPTPIPDNLRAIVDIIYI